MALDYADIDRLLNYPAWTGGPTISQALKTANEVSDLIKNQTAQITVVREPFAQPNSPAANKVITKVQDDADTNTIVRMLAKKEGLLPS